MAKIVHFGKFYFPDLGGIESVTVSMARGAVAFGHSVSVVCFSKNALNHEEIIHGVKVFRAPIKKIISSQPLGIKYLLLCLKLAKEADIIHIHAPNMLAAICALFVGKQPRLLVHWHSDVLNKGLLGKLLRPLEYFLLCRADVIVAATQVYADASNELKSFTAKIKILPFGVGTNIQFNKKSELPPLIENKINGRKIILSVGRLVPYKGFNFLIEAAKYLPKNVVVVIVGAGPLESELVKKIKLLGVNDNVILTGRLSDSELNSLFKSADLFCLPSTYRAEAFGMVLIEAMAHGLPIVASDISGSGVSWVNQHGISGYNVPVGNPQEIANACDQILESADIYNKLSQGARKRFSEEFTEEIFIQRIMSIYEHMLKIKNKL